MRESDEAIASGDHQMLQAQDPGGGRVFGDDEEEAEKMKRKIMIEEGMNSEEEDSVEDSIDEEEMTEVESVAALPEEEPEPFDDVSDDDIDSLFGPA